MRTRTESRIETITSLRRALFRVRYENGYMVGRLSLTRAISPHGGHSIQWFAATAFVSRRHFAISCYLRSAR